MNPRETSAAAARRTEWRALSFDALLAGLRQDRWDMVIASFGIPPERSKPITFTSPHSCRAAGRTGDDTHLGFSAKHYIN